jgi:hypothetical protein
MVAATLLTTTAAAAQTATPQAAAADQPAQIEQLQALRRTLSNAPDPNVFAAARTQLDTILAAQAHRVAEPAVPPALATIVTRIDSAITRLEQASAHRAVPTPINEPAIETADNLTQIASPLATVGIAATSLILLLALLLGQRRQNNRLTGVITGLAQVNTRIGAAATDTGRTLAASDAERETASAIGMEATLAVARLNNAILDAQTQLQRCCDDVATSQDKSSALANQCERLTQALPNLLAAAIDTMQVRGLASIDAVGTRLRESAGRIESVTSALRDSADGVIKAGAAQLAASESAEGSAAALANHVERLAGAITAVERRSQATADVVADQLTAGAFSIDAAVAGLQDGVIRLTEFESLSGRLRDTTEAIETATASLHAGLESLADAGATQAAAAAALRADTTLLADAVRQPTAVLGEAVARGEALSHVWPEITASLASAAAALRREAQDGAKTLADGGAAINRLTAAANVAIDQATASVTQLNDVAAAQARLQGCLPACISSLQTTADAVRQEGETLADLLRAHTTANADLPNLTMMLNQCATRAEAAFTNGIAGLDAATARLDTENQEDALLIAALAARAEAAIAALPTQAAEIAAAAAALRADAATLSEAVGGLNIAEPPPADAVVTALTGPTAVLESVSNRLEHAVAGLNGANGTLREGAAAIRQEASRASAEAQAAGALLARLAEDAATHIAAIAVAAPRDATQTTGVLSDVAAALASHTARLGDLLTSGQEANARVATLAETAATHIAALAASPAPAAELARLEAAVAHVTAAAATLAQRAEAQDQAAARVAQAAHDVAAAAASATPPAKHHEPPAADVVPTLTRLAMLAGEAETLLATATSLAERASRGEANSLPGDMLADIPALLATIDIGVQRLRGTATAFALAGDAARLAA